MVLNIENTISREALHQRFNPEASDFLKTCLERATEITSKHSSKVEFRGLRKFKRVCIWDSTGWRLNEKLSKVLPGSGGYRSFKAGCKLQYCYDLKSHSVVHCELTNAITPDQRYSQEQIAEHVQKNDLFIFDLGYYALSTLKAIASKGGYFVSRVEPQTTMIVDEKRCDLLQLLKKRKHQQLVEEEILLGKDQIRCRLVAKKLPRKETIQRIKRLNKRAAKNGRTISAQRKLLAGWNVFVTNASADKIPTNKVGEFYRLRWSIELVFKQFKSLLKMHTWNHANINRLKCEVYAMLIVATIISFTHGLIQAKLWRKQEREASFEKTCKLFTNSSAEIFGLVKRKFNNHRRIFKEFLIKAMRLCVKKRQISRLTTIQRIHN